MKRLLLLISSLLTGLCWAGPDGDAPTKAISEYTMKALYLYNFAQLTEWPTAAAANKFNLCVAGQEEVATALDSLRSRAVAGRPLNPVRVETAADAKSCDVLYIGEQGGERNAALFNVLRDASVLTVTDDSRLANSRPMLFVFQNGKRLAFDVDLGAARRYGIRFSSKLLQLAHQVRE